MDVLFFLFFHNPYRISSSQHKAGLYRVYFNKSLTWIESSGKVFCPIRLHTQLRAFAFQTMSLYWWTPRLFIWELFSSYSVYSETILKMKWILYWNYLNFKWYLLRARWAWPTHSVLREPLSGCSSGLQASLAERGKKTWARIHASPKSFHMAIWKTVRLKIFHIALLDKASEFGFVYP